MKQFKVLITETRTYAQTVFADDAEQAKTIAQATHVERQTGLPEYAAQVAISEPLSIANEREVVWVGRYNVAPQIGWHDDRPVYDYHQGEMNFGPCSTAEEVMAAIKEATGFDGDYEFAPNHGLHRAYAEKDNCSSEITIRAIPKDLDQQPSWMKG
jgi:hypothetical protein